MARLLVCPGPQHEGRVCRLGRLPGYGMFRVPMLLLEAEQRLHLQVLLGTIGWLCREC